MPLRIIPPLPEQIKPDDLVHVEHGEFVRSGNLFRSVGVNYWPLTVAGQEAGSLPSRVAFT